jgi:hypothetical protein
MDQRITDRRRMGSMQTAEGVSRGRRRVCWGRGTILALVAVVVSLAAMPAAADDYDPKDAGHPLRIIAYVLHPVGVVFDYLVMRPAHWLGSQEPLKTFFGHED